MTAARPGLQILRREASRVLAARQPGWAPGAAPRRLRSTAPWPRGVFEGKRPLCAAGVGAGGVRTPWAGQRRLLTDEAKKMVESAVGSAPVVLFMKGTPAEPRCGFSRAALQILGLQGVDLDKFAAFDVLDSVSLREGIKEFSDWPTIPQLYVDREFVGGCDIMLSMHQKGDLAKLLASKDVLEANPK